MPPLGYITCLMKNLLHDSLVSIHALCTIEGDARDPHFSWSPCDCCGSPLGGDRFECEVLIVLDGKLHQEDNCNACPDCLDKWQ